MPDQIQNNPSSQNNTPPEIQYRQPGAFEHGKKNWFALHHLLAYTLIGLVFLAIIAGAYYYQVSHAVPDTSFNPPVHHAKTDSDSKTYTNDQYGFEFNYPNYWSSQLDPDGVAFTLENQGDAFNPVLVGNFNATTFTDIEKWFSYEYKDRKDITKTNITISGQSALQIDLAALAHGNLVEFDLIKNGILFNFKFDSASNKEINQILSTFKFLDYTIHTSGTNKIYTNTKYGYEFQYPSNWQASHLSGWAVIDPQVKSPDNITYINSDENIKAYEGIKSGTVYGEGADNNISITVEPSSKSLKDIIAEKQKDPAVVGITAVTFAGQPAYEMSEGGFGVYFYIITKKDNNLFTIRFGYKGDRLSLSPEENQILSTFKFTK
jgi:hypothetical protein